MLVLGGLRPPVQQRSENAIFGFPLHSMLGVVSIERLTYE
jgi:hypothetical protein